MAILTKYWRIIIPIVLLPFVFIAFAWVTTPSTKNIRSCFQTSFNKVELCSKGPNYIPIGEVPQHFIDSLLVAEDVGFFGHGGVDFFEIIESFKQNLSQKRFKRGGSTISQQLAKNLYLNSDKSVLRKLREYFVTRSLENELSKNEILEKYINVVEFGANIYGLKPAAQFYFNKYPSSLNFYESLLLTHVLPNPKKYGPSLSSGKLGEWSINKLLIHLERLLTYKKIEPELYSQLKQRFINMSDGEFVEEETSEPLSDEVNDEADVDQSQAPPVDETNPEDSPDTANDKPLDDEGSTPIVGQEETPEEPEYSEPTDN